MGDGVVDGLRWRVAGASVCGAGHEKTGVPCQDAHCWREHESGLWVVAVADGAGSACLSQEGAATATSAAVDHLSSMLSSCGGQLREGRWEEILAETVEAARKAVELHAGTRSAPVSDLASTLILVAAGKDFVAATQIGDGAVIVDGGGVVQTLLRPAATEYLNETVFLTSATALEDRRTVIWQGVPSHIAVMSDGLQMAALQMPEGVPHPGFFRPIFEFLSQQENAGEAEQALSAFLSSPRLRQRTDDDVTLVVASVKP